MDGSALIKRRVNSSFPGKPDVSNVFKLGYLRGYSGRDSAKRLNIFSVISLIARRSSDGMIRDSESRAMKMLGDLGRYARLHAGIFNEILRDKREGMDTIGSELVTSQVHISPSSSRLTKDGKDLSKSKKQ